MDSLVLPAEISRKKVRKIIAAIESEDTDSIGRPCPHYILKYSRDVMALTLFRRSGVVTAALKLSITGIL
jgi:hypothetical protein